MRETFDSWSRGWREVWNISGDATKIIHAEDAGGQRKCAKGAKTWKVIKKDGPDKKSLPKRGTSKKLRIFKKCTLPPRVFHEHDLIFCFMYLMTFFLLPSSDNFDYYFLERRRSNAICSNKHH